MSRWLGKQGSVESPGAGYGSQQQGRRLSEDTGQSSKPKLNRSLTISGQSGSGHPSVEPRGPTSPLKRFALAKDAIRKAFQHLGERLDESRTFMQTTAQLGGDGSGSDQGGGVVSLMQRTQEIQKILSRDRMKVAFFGRTSNGKSSVINALLHGRVLPVGIGHTTNCFCSVAGAEGEDGYILIGDTTAERRSLKSVQQLAHSLSSEHLDPSALVRIFWPTTKCPLLAEDVEFVDSPGVDMSANIDEWITKHCLDADVFVLVSNAESTLMNAEKSFFHRVSERISKPNVFILNNRWDASDAADITEGEEEEDEEGGAVGGGGGAEGVDGRGPRLMEQVMQQHLQRDIKFLAEELSVTDEHTARHRVFFVSAKEVLHYRLRKNQKSSNPGQGLAPGHRARLQNFEEFERKFKECLSSSAIRTKFEQHYKQGEAVVNELSQQLSEQDSLLQQRSLKVKTELEACQRRGQELGRNKPILVANGDELVSTAMGQVMSSLSKAVKDLLSQLLRLVDHYEGEFDPGDLSPYKRSLYTHFDEQLCAELERVNAAVVTNVYQQTQEQLIEAHQQLIQLPETELERLRETMAGIHANYALQCAELCEDFREDLQFHFSLGLNTISSLATTGSWITSLRSKINILQSVVSVEYAAPVALLISALVLRQFLRLRYLLPVIGVGVGLYSYEWLAWTPRAKEAALKRQFVQHVSDKVQLQVKTVNNSCVFQMQTNLQSLRNRLLHKLDTTKDRVEREGQQLATDRNTMSVLSQKLKALRNAVQLSRADLDKFRKDFLE